jgi:hypothetical protein
MDTHVRRFAGCQALRGIQTPPTFQYEYNGLGLMTKLIDANNRASQF